MNTSGPSPEPRQELFQEENITAEQHIAESDLPAAARILVKIVEGDPQNWRAFNNLGIISWMQKAWQDAFLMFQKSVTLKPDYIDALMNLFDAGLKLRKIEQIIPNLEAALALDPNLQEASVLLDSIRQQGDEIYQSERALLVGTHNPLIEEANKLLEDGKVNEAMAKYLEANDIQGPTAEAFCGLGVVSYYQQRYLDAFTLFFESIKLNPADPDVFMNLLDAAKNCDRVEMAKKIYSAYRSELPSLQSLEKDFETAI